MAKNREPEKLVESETEPSEEEDETSSEEIDSEPEFTQSTQKPSYSTPATNLPQAAEEEESDSESESESDSDGPNQKVPSIATKSIPQAAEEEEDESESESESDSDGPNQKVPSVANKAVHDLLKSSAGAINPRSNPVADPATPSKFSAVKHPAEEKENDAKTSNLETSVKKPFIQRIWSEKDEIVLLKGMIDYSAKKKRDLIADVSSFYDFIKKDLDFVDVTQTQLLTKMKRLKQKYNNNKSKGKEGKERILRKPHEQDAYELSKILWGNENVKENGSEKVIGSPKANNGCVVKKVLDKRANSVDNEAAKKVTSLPPMKDKFESVLPAKRAKLSLMGDQTFGEGIVAEEWKKLKMEEYDAYLRHLDVKTRQIKVVMDNSKPGH